MKKKEKVIFEVRDVLSTRTLLWKSAFYHASFRHPSSGIFVEKVKETLTNPYRVVKDKYGAYLFYGKLTLSEKEIMGTTNDYLVVCTKPKGTFRFVASYYSVSSIKKGEKVYESDKGFERDNSR